MYPLNQPFPLPSAGDIFECEGDMRDDTLWKSNSFDIEKQNSSRKLILDIADHIIPGHGVMFKVALS